MPACRTCRRPIVWEKTGAGKGIPLDPEPKPNGNVVIRGSHGVRIAHVLKDGEPPIDGEPRFSCHFETCPDAAKHRRR